MSEAGEKIKIWMADDHQLILDGYRLLLSARSDLEIAGESNNGKDLLASLEKNEVQLIISDLRMPGMDGLLLMEEIKKRHPKTPLLVVSMSDELELIYQLFQAEVEGFILKNSGKTELYTAIDDLLAGGIHYEKTIMAQLLPLQRTRLKAKPQTGLLLSPREMEVLQLIFQEKTSRQIAEQLFISKQTVDTHRIHIYEKTGTRTLVGLIKFGLERGRAWPSI
jgi:DNA-binding NarL/FixJ family response regulator